MEEQEADDIPWPAVIYWPAGHAERTPFEQYNPSAQFAVVQAVDDVPWPAVVH